MTTKTQLCWSQRDGYYEQPRPAAFEWLADENLYVGYRRLGYEEWWEAGDRDLDHIIVWRLREPTEGMPPFVFSIWDVNHGEEVAVWTIVDAMGFRDHLFARFVFDENLKNLLELAAKAFHAWHGHDRFTACWNCDPHLMRRMQEWRIERERQKAQGTRITMMIRG